MKRFLFAILIAVMPTLANARSPDWHPLADDLCLHPPFEDPQTSSQQTVRDLLSALAGVADRLVTNLHDHDVVVCIDPSPSEAHGYFEFDEGFIAIDSHLETDTKLVVLIHELRHVDQFFRGYCPSVDFDLKEATRFTYAVEADAQAITTYLTWIMAQNGAPGPWQALNQMERYGDISKAFKQSIADGAPPDIAISSAFDQWYEAKWRTDSYFFSTCSGYLDELDKTKRLRSYKLLPDDYFDRLCLLPDGRHYACNTDPLVGSEPPQPSSDAQPDQ